jgi:hypothetical protein
LFWYSPLFSKAVEKSGGIVQMFTFVWGGKIGEYLKGSEFNSFNEDQKVAALSVIDLLKTIYDKLEQEKLELRVIDSIKNSELITLADLIDPEKKMSRDYLRSSRVA